MSGADFVKRTDCRICGGARLTRFLELGPQPLANRFLRPDEPVADEPSFPLDVYLCADCSLVQLCDVVAPQVLFRDYIYVSGTSATMPAHFAELAGMVRERFLQKPGSLVVEAGSNDGTLLSAFSGSGVRALGVEPATNIAELARKRGVDTLNDFFGERTALEVRKTHGAASAILGNNVFAHVDDTRAFVRGVKGLLADDGAFVFEVPYLFDLIDQIAFDTVYHEHLCYFSITALDQLFRAHELAIFDVVPQAVHGGTVRVFVQHAGGPHAATAARQRYLTEEARRGVRELGTYEALARRVLALRDELTGLLRQLRGAGKRIAGYGSAAKGNTLLNFMRIGPELVGYVVDKSPLKQGLLTPGMHLPVRPVEQLTEDRPDYVLILAWNFADEIVAQQRRYLEAGGRFIVPLPRPRIIEQQPGA
jgi:SAM-dependent methyltransferase